MNQLQQLDKDSIYLLQLIDCNCNECVHLERDFEKFNKWKAWNHKLQLEAFEKFKAKEVSDAESNLAEAKAIGDAHKVRSLEGVLKKAQKLYFQFNGDGLLTYGTCKKLNKSLCFQPNICQVETQQCFEHRKAN